MGKLGTLGGPGGDNTEGEHSWMEKLEMVEKSERVGIWGSLQRQRCLEN